MSKIIINQCHGGYGLSEEAYKYLGLEWDGYGYEFSDERTNPDLIRVVEKLGDVANGTYASLTVVEISDEVDWDIYNYDGMEHIYDKDRVWGL